jgi:hypothetical protein
VQKRVGTVLQILISDEHKHGVTLGGSLTAEKTEQENTTGKRQKCREQGKMF